MAEPCLSVVMPCFNEESTVAAAVRRVLASPYTAEVLVVDDGSTDGTGAAVRQVVDDRVRVLTQPVNRGKGAAVRRGFREATAPFVVVQDGDLEYDPADFEQVLSPLLDGRADVVFGSRFHTARPHRVLYYWHSVGNRLLTTASNMTTNLNLSDMETCYKAFRREVVESLELEEDGFGFEPEVTAKVAQGGWRIYEVGISYSGRTYAEGKKIGWRDGFDALRCVVRYSAPLSRLRARRPAPRAVTFDEADAELADALHSLDDARAYAGWIAALLEPHLGDDVLEVGAGHGTITELLARHGRRVTASEPSPRAAAELRRRFAGRGDVVVRDAALSDAVHPGGHSSVVLVNVLEHIEDDAKALALLAGAVVPGGAVAVFVPALESLYSAFDRRVGHHRRYGRRALRRLMADAGLDVVTCRYVNSVGALAWWLLARQLGATPTARGPALLYDRLVVPWLRRVEDVVTPPFGQSLLAVGRRPQGPPP